MANKIDPFSVLCSSMNNRLTKARIEISLLFLLYFIMLPRVYMTYDVGYYTEWALYIHQHGFQNTYYSTSNYPPVYMYALYLYDLLQGTDANIIRNINNIKVLFLLFDFLPLAILCCFRQKILSFNIPYLYLLINAAYLFNSMVWGQLDGTYTNIVFLAIITGIFYPVTGALLFMFALNTKMQTIMFAPVMGMILLYSVRKVKTAVVGIIGALALQVLILLPFIVSGNLGRVIHVFTHGVDYYNNLSICAFNIWYLIVPGNPFFIKSNDVFLIFSYKTIGLAMFSIALLAILVPLLKRIWQLRKKHLPFDAAAYEALFLSTGMAALVFFYFNAQMHERYAHPIIIFFFFYGVVSRNYKLYILASIPYFLSLDKAFSYPDGYLPIVHYKIIFASRIIALWYTATLIYGSYLLYKLSKREAQTSIPNS